MERDYWNSYYSSKGAPALPSQFAVFTLGERTPDLVIDVGCGSGRDTFWFAAQGIRTVGIDGSEAAIEMCSSRSGTGPGAPEFLCLDITSGDFRETLRRLAEKSENPLVYARFFLHAIAPEEQDSFLASAGEILALAPDGVLAVEFRTERDQALTKSTTAHYRRFIAPASVVLDASRHGLLCVYSVEGFGFAKYKTDDAYVARLIFTKR